MSTPVHTEPEYLTVAQFAKKLDIYYGTVLGWIHSGKLAAVDIGQQMQLRQAMWRIPVSEYERLRRRAEANVDGI